MRIALYIGNSLYPTSGVVQQTIDQLHASQLTSPILSLLNKSADDPTKLVYNDGGNEVFNNQGNYIGDPTWASDIQTLKSGGNIQEVYLSFSTNGCEYMADLIQSNKSAAASILYAIKNDLGFDGIDLDYEGSDLYPESPIYAIAEIAKEVGLPLTAAPYRAKEDWQQWVTYVQGNGGTVSWLNLQCYAGGKSNNPGTWLDIGTDIVAGSCNNCASPQTTCSPNDMQELFTLWRTGMGSVTYACWAGIPNTKPQNIGGGFIWVYSSIKDNYDAYINAVATGLGM